MERYRNRSGDSGVIGYELDQDRIIVYFKNRSVYEYTNQSAGALHVERMKKLAAEGEGLNTFINQYVRGNYSRRIR